MSADGSNLLYSAYLGGSNRDYGSGIAIDNAGDIYLTGRVSSTDFPLENAFQTTFSGAFVAKLRPAGNLLLYSTYLGGSGSEEGYDIAVDSSGDAYIIGITNSTDFPTQNPVQGYGGGLFDAFVVKLRPDGSAPLYGTYLGGSDLDEVWDIALDSAANIYVVGRTYSSDFPLANPLQAAFGGGTDAFITKLKADGSPLLYSTYLGGNGYDDGFGIAVDNANNIYVGGRTSSTDFPLENPLQSTFGGGTDAFVAQLKADGSALLFSTYFGGSSSDDGLDLDIDSGGNPYLVGYTDSSGNGDVFVTRMDMETPPLKVEVTDSQGNPVTALSLNAEGWPTPNPLTATVTLSCPAGGADCIDLFSLEIDSSDGNARFYVYDMEQGDTDEECPSNAVSFTGSEFSYESYESDCLNDLYFYRVYAGESRTLNWSVWVQPSKAATLNVSAVWGSNSDSEALSIEQAQIHPIMFIHGLSASLPPSYEQDEALLGVSDLMTGYSKLFETLEKMGYEKDRTLFIYTYDWLYSVIQAATHLRLQRLTPDASTAGNVPWVDSDEGVQFDIVTHSTGGLIARAYIQTSIWNNDVRRVVMIAPPLAGVMKGYGGWEGSNPDLGPIDILLDDVFIPGRAYDAGYGELICWETCTISLPAKEQYAFVHDPLQGMTILPEFLPDRQDGEQAYLEDNDTGVPYPYDRQANPLLEPARVVDNCNKTHASNGIPEVCDPYFNDYSDEYNTDEYNTVYYGLNEPEQMRLFDERIGLENLFIVYGDGYSGDDMPIGFKVAPPSDTAPYWRNGERVDSYGDLGDGTVPVMSALPKGIWFDAEGNPSNIISDTNSFNVEEAHLKRGIDPGNLKHASLVAFTESQSVTVKALTGQPLPSNFITEFGPSDAGFRLAEFNQLTLENLLILIFSPAELTLTDAQGRRLGYDPATGEDLTEIPYGVYLREEDTGHKTIYIPSPEEGEMNLTVTGVGKGDYTLLGYFRDETAIVNLFVITGATTVGQVDTVPFTVPATSAEVPVPPDVQLGSDLSVDINQPVAFNGQFSDINPDETHTLHWDFGDGGAASGTLTPTHIFTAEGVFTVTLTVTDSFGFAGNDSLLVTVEDTSPTAPSADVGDYAVFGLNSVWLKKGSDLHSGHVGAQNVSPGPVLNANAEVTIGRKVTFHDSASVIAGDTVRLKRKGDVYSIFCNELSAARKVTYTQVITPLNLPLVTNLPALPEITPGSTDYTLAPGEHLTLTAGAYGNIKLKRNSVLTLTGGVYQLNNLDLGKKSQLQITAPTEIRIANRLKPGQKAIIGPAPGSGLNGTDLVIFVAGTNGDDGSLAAAPKAAVIGYNNIVTATIYVPNGTLWLKQGTEARGAFIGQDVKIGYNAQIWLESAFAGEYQSP